eukprot:TRINITY_DN11130_c0_g1_i2.p1 TRINITY_DN11130_c0_g1~~TRINITY_DN11130_c0_g1_i2.p1  ORF type:complete len:185 (+),score=58.43 TRINITY_DN11130_c0_g1_i2:2-556(+)
MSSDWWSWGTGILNSVKQTSEQIINVYKDDIAEFGSVVTQDTKKIIAENRQILERDGAAAITNKLTEGVTTGISKLSEGIQTLSDISTNILHPKPESNEVLEKMNKLQEDPASLNDFIMDPQFIEWQKTFDWNTKKSETEIILSSQKDILNTYTQLGTLPSISNIKQHKQPTLTLPPSPCSHIS